MLHLSLDLHWMLLLSIYFAIKPSSLKEMVIHKPQLFFLFIETKLKTANVSYKYIFTACWKSNHYIHFNRYCSLRDFPHLKLYEINICTLAYILAAQERNTGEISFVTTNFRLWKFPFLFRAAMELFLILQSCILCSNVTEMCFCDIVHIKQDAKLQYLKH